MLAFGGAIGLAIVPCWIYVDVVTGARASEAATLLQQQLLARAEPVIAGLCELGSALIRGGLHTLGDDK